MSEINKFVKTLEGKPVLVYGLGKSGDSVVRALTKAGAEIVIGDDNPESYKKFKSKKVSPLDMDEQDFSKFAFLVFSPGIPFTHPKPHKVVEKAQAAGLEIMCDIELFMLIYPSLKTIGITGTNGKSTVSTLMDHVLNSVGKKSVFGGNIGTAVFNLDIEGENPPEWVVLELSSFQIDLCPTFRPDISVMINLTPDHIDRHGTMENYASVKERLCHPSRGEGKDDGVAVICSDDKFTQEILERAIELGEREIVEVSMLKQLSSGVYVDHGQIYDAMDQEAELVGDINKVATLKGVHNHQNAICAYAIAKKIGIEPQEIMAGLMSYPGLNHRQYLVRTINGVGYVNDSKSTNAASAAMALGCQKNVYWIVGGRKKKTGLDGLEPFFDHIKHAFLIGESTEDFSRWFDKYGIDYTRCFTMENAIGQANVLAQANRGQPGGTGVVLLSPACASFDQYDSFEHRGDHFSELAMAIDEET